MIRNIIFKFFFYIGTIIISVIFLPALILPQKITLIGGKVLGYWIHLCLSLFLSVKIEVKGKENIPKNSNFFIASLHQSLFETFFLQTVFNYPVFITNSDIVINSDLNKILKFHKKKKNDITLVASSKKFEIPYGVCNVDNCVGDDSAGGAGIAGSACNGETTELILIYLYSKLI